MSVGTLIRLFGGSGRSRLGMPLALVGAIAFASALTIVPTEVAPLATGFDGVRLVLQEFARGGGYEQSPRLVAPIVVGILALEYALLAWGAERLVRAAPALAPRLVLVSLIAHAGAGFLDLQRIAGAALRSGAFLAALPEHLLSTRVSMQTDVNAAGSLFVLAGIAGIGVLRGSTGRRMAVAGLGLLVLAGLWVTGSRAALLSAIGTVGLALGWRAMRRRGRARLAAGLATAVVVIAATIVAANYSSGRSFSVSASVQGRMALARAGLVMFKSAPAFGIGVTRFYERSAETVERRARRPSARKRA